MSSPFRLSPAARIACFTAVTFLLLLGACRKTRDIPPTKPLPLAWTATPTFTPTPSPTITPTPTETIPEAPTDTPTSTPSITSTPTPTVTYVPGVVCTVVASSPAFVAEIEPPDATLVNDFCASADVLGTLAFDLVVTGVLRETAMGTPFYEGSDYDLYRFTTGVAGIWRVSLDCFTTGSDGRNFDYYVSDGVTCSTFAAAATGTGPVETYAYSLPAGTTLVVWVLGADGPGGPYRLTIDAP